MSLDVRVSKAVHVPGAHEGLHFRGRYKWLVDGADNNITAGDTVLGENLIKIALLN